MFCWEWTGKSAWEGKELIRFYFRAVVSPTSCCLELYGKKTLSPVRILHPSLMDILNNFFSIASFNCCFVFCLFGLSFFSFFFKVIDPCFQVVYKVWSFITAFSSENCSCWFSSLLLSHPSALFVLFYPGRPSSDFMSHGSYHCATPPLPNTSFPMLILSFLVL